MNPVQGGSQAGSALSLGYAYVQQPLSDREVLELARWVYERFSTDSDAYKLAVAVITASLQPVTA